MSDDRLPVPRPERLPVDAGTGLRRTSQAPIHQPGPLSFGPAPDRAELWATLGETVQSKVYDAVGRPDQWIEWWAQLQADGRVHVVVLGRPALVVVQPTMHSSGRRTMTVHRHRLREDSFKSKRFSGPMAPGGAGRPAAGVTDISGPEVRISTEMSGFLGLLPASAQQLLQEPFVSTAAGDLEYERFYRRTGLGHGIGGAQLMVWCYLTDRRTLTFCAGIGTGYRDPHPPTSWSLTCWQATAGSVRR